MDPDMCYGNRNHISEETTIESAFFEVYLSSAEK